MDAKAPRDLGRGILGLGALIGATWVILKGPGSLPWAWLLGAMALGFVMLTYADVIDGRAAQRRLDADEEWERRFPEEE